MSRIRSSNYKHNPRKASRVAYVKLRVVPLVRMPKSVLLDKVRWSCENGVLDPEIDVRYVEYDHAYKGVRKGYTRISKRDKLEALENFRRLVMSADTVDIE